MITYRFVSQTFLGEPVKVQYSKYSSPNRIDLGSGTFPFEYTTDQKGGTYYFYIPKLDTTFTKTIDIPPVDFVINSMNVPDCDISGITITIPECDISAGIIEIPVCDVDYNVVIVEPSPTPTSSVVCPILTGVTVGPIEISGGDYTLTDNLSNLYLYQFNSSGQYINDIASPGNSILPDSLFEDEITVLVPSPYWFGGPCQYCFNINTSEEVPCNSVIPSPTPTPSITNTNTPTITSTPSVTPTLGITPSITPTITPTPSITSTVTQTLPIQTSTPTNTPTTTLTPSVTPTITNTPTTTTTICNCISISASTPGDGVFLITLQGDGKVPRKDYAGLTPITNTQIKLQFFSGVWNATLNGNIYGNTLSTTSVCPIGTTWTSTPEITIYSTTYIICP